MNSKNSNNYIDNELCNRSSVDVGVQNFFSNEFCSALQEMKGLCMARCGNSLDIGDLGQNTNIEATDYDNLRNSQSEFVDLE